MKKSICIYHKNCADGFGAAWSVWHNHGDEFEYHAASYGEEPPNCSGRDVYIVDFSYKKPAMESIAKQANLVVVLDHHKTAEADLKELLREGSIDGIFDMNKSGAMLAWEWFHPDQEPPQLIKHIQDRDLWKFELDGTREIQAALFSYPFEFEVWGKMICGADVDQLRKDGVAIERQHHKDVAELVDAFRRKMVIGGYAVPVANIPYILTSDSGHMMAQNQPFAACYWDTPNGRTFSLRSANDGLDVSEIAKSYGGGGHKHAAGFEVPFDELQSHGLL